MTMEARSTSPVIGFIDVDSFECQLFQRDFPEYRKTPCVVANRCGRIVSVTNEAKQLGVSRSTTPNIRDARKVCPGVHAFIKPNVYGKPDSKKTRHATWEVFDCIQKYCSRFGDDIMIELASSDELFIDLSAEITRQIDKRRGLRCHERPLKIPPNVISECRYKSKKGPFFYGMKLEEARQHLKYLRQEEARLAHGALFMSQLCNFLFSKTQLKASAGVATNKLLAKVGCGINKPANVTIFHGGALYRLSEEIPIGSIPGLGGLRTEILMNEFGAKSVSDLRRLTLAQLESRFDPNTSQRIYGWARGNDNHPVREEHMKNGLTCNKPMGDITKMFHLENTVSNLCNEVLSRLDEEKDRHHRTVDTIRLGCTYMAADKSKRSMSEVLRIDNIIKIKELPLKAVESIFGQPDFAKDKFRILELKIVVKDFYLVNDPEMLIKKLLSVPSKELMLNCKILPTSSFTDRRHIGSFRSTADQKYSEHVDIPKIIPWTDLQELIGRYLGEGFEEAQSTLISDHTAYYELKHRFFLQWLQEEKYMDNVKSGKFKKPDFIAFGGRVADILKSPASKLNADWEIYALNFGNTIYLWNQKKPQVAKTTMLPSFFGIKFERLVTKEDQQSVSEYEMMYVVNQLKLDTHEILVVSNVDGLDEHGHWTEVTVMNDFKDQNFMFQRLLALWAQCTVPGVKNILVGTKEEGIVKEIKMKSVQDLSAQLGDSPMKCTQFLSRFLTFVKMHLPVSDANRVKCFSWTCGSFKVICTDVQQQEIPNLIVPRLYKSYFKMMEKIMAAKKERTNSSVA